MSISANGTNITSVTFNGVSYESVTVNGVVVLSPPPPPVTNLFADHVYDGNLTITVPAGYKIASFSFGSYGTPTGSNGVYATSSCNSNALPWLNTNFLNLVGSKTKYFNGDSFGPDPCCCVSKYLNYVAVLSPV